ncbi:hypothetical protein [Psychrobacillus lasiicapitis]|uniref:Polyhydroxyalkanoic acid inclusion protein PhaP n=1 Tax=Psychrobacillus lasiicapitis TaxID=1636719 RepID=A0A544T1Z0_9BACI|nr:hypothetical protein [Psychrobacillus lasiicapitis]TQR11466.1 hypothetical protein FG382_16140 [Psychrobacillus lasiicapitis]GGA40302.1 hypothetical protein GCM10011384_32370 [Psychrobacillus lasiicapitis]
MAREQLSNGVDLLWDGWLNGFKTLQSLQDDVQKKAFQAFTYQKELLDSTVATLSAMEEETKKATQEWQDKVQTSVNGISGNTQLQQVTTWLNNIQEINDKAQALSWKPSYAVLDLFVQSQNHLESTVKAALEQQKQEREETLHKIEELTALLKGAHKDLLVSVGV